MGPTETEATKGVERKAEREGWKLSSVTTPFSHTVAVSKAVAAPSLPGTKKPGRGRKGEEYEIEGNPAFFNLNYAVFFHLLNILIC